MVEGRRSLTAIHPIKPEKGIKYMGILEEGYPSKTNTKNIKTN